MTIAEMFYADLLAALKALSDKQWEEGKRAGWVLQGDGKRVD